MSFEGDRKQPVFQLRVPAFPSKTAKPRQQRPDLSFWNKVNLARSTQRPVSRRRDKQSPQAHIHNGQNIFTLIAAPIGSDIPRPDARAHPPGGRWSL